MLDGRRSRSPSLSVGDNGRSTEARVEIDETDFARRFWYDAFPTAADLLSVDTVDAIEDMLTVREC